MINTIDNIFFTKVNKKDVKNLWKLAVVKQGMSKSKNKTDILTKSDVDLFVQILNNKKSKLAYVIRIIAHELSAATDDYYIEKRIVKNKFLNGVMENLVDPNYETFYCYSSSSYFCEHDEYDLFVPEQYNNYKYIQYDYSAESLIRDYNYLTNVQVADIFLSAINDNCFCNDTINSNMIFNHDFDEQDINYLNHCWDLKNNKINFYYKTDENDNLSVSSLYLKIDANIFKRIIYQYLNFIKYSKNKNVEIFDFKDIAYEIDFLFENAKNILNKTEIVSNDVNQQSYSFVIDNDLLVLLNGLLIKIRDEG